MVLRDLITDFVAPLDAILLPLLAVLDAVGPIGRDVATPIGARLGTIGASSRHVGAILNPIGRRTRFGARKLAGRRTALGTSVLQELGGSATGNSSTDGRAQI